MSAVSECASELAPAQAGGAVGVFRYRRGARSSAGGRSRMSAVSE